MPCDACAGRVIPPRSRSPFVRLPHLLSRSPLNVSLLTLDDHDGDEC